ncbi:hypothetical protein MRS76_21260 [Rhizobiaceae bacterium n13]|uniref:Uncharacterized protein n=1 Tax=Ferirhizobium litorale TaxID=2927786 RepID=A0AAE3QFC4_9HYPH|nr:hypothetical protein [Fererhizobium litorale]MDI7864467.1 hypothetical protein [Fererhizobium litorale]MDI7924782.1 hypothetical protein [Fererhizobium litorale]
MPDIRMPEPPEKKKKPPLWPWIVLLVLTLTAIYTYDRAALAFDQFVRHVPDEIFHLFEELLGRQTDMQPSPPVEI